MVESDVSRFTFHRSDEHVYVRRMAGGKFNDHCVMKSVRIMVWGCIHSTGAGFLTNDEERLNEDAYIDLLGNYMIPSVQQYLNYHCPINCFTLYYINSP